jgi:glycosyltransferase involved in cell wall biosynthesis
MTQHRKVYHVGFILEQALGHITHSQNLQANLPKYPAITPHWALIPFEVRGMAARLPVYKSNWTVRAGWRARQQVSALSHQTTLDALFFHTQVPAVLSADWLRRIPSIVSLDATPLQYDALGAAYNHQPGPAWLEGIKRRLNVACYHAARRLVAWSQWAKDGLVQGYGIDPAKVTVIYPGVDVCAWTRPTPRIASQPVPDRAVRPVKILFVGGDLERKGGKLLLQAFRQLRPLGVELHVVTRDALEPEPCLFTYHDLQPNSNALKQMYWQCDIFCLPTLGDCLPMVLSEAGAAGLPLVSTSVAAIPELVRDGETGFRVPAGDVAALTSALHRLVVDAALRQRLGAQAAELVAQAHDAECNALRLCDLLKHVADGNVVVEQ